MPELPEVQTLVDALKGAGLCGARIASARVYWPRSISEPSPGAFCRRLRGLTVAEIRRRGKYLVFDFSEGGHLLLHLRMTGRLCLLPPDAPRSKHEHVVIVLEEYGDLRLHDTRKFGRLYFMDDCEALLGRLGPEPLNASFTAGRLAEMLRPRRCSLKPLLLDQTFIAGLGNIYVDEALWAARIHPLRTASSLSEGEAASLHRAIARVLKQGLRNQGTTLGRGHANFHSLGYRRGRNQAYLKVFRRAGSPCFRCGSEIERITVGQRSTHLCPQCQRK